MKKLSDVRAEIQQLSNAKDAAQQMRYFKTGPGEYAEGDVFLGIRVPVLRKLAKQCMALKFTEIKSLLKAEFHEERLLALIILVERFKQAGDAEQQMIYDVYLQHASHINNWDLVDVSASYIVGGYLASRDKKPLYHLVKSNVLWERRIAIIATLTFIKQDQFHDTLTLAKALLKDKEDLMHKAVGWMLREVGKRDLAAEEGFLKMHYQAMPRTMLRYAIEKFGLIHRVGHLASIKKHTASSIAG